MSETEEKTITSLSLLSREKKCVNGIHRDVSQFSFTRMYLNISIAYNICPSTIAPESAKDEDCNLITLKSGVIIRFLKSHIKEGVTPKLYKQMETLRSDLRSTLRETKVRDDEKYFDNVQLKLKKNMNNVYSMMPLVCRECIIAIANQWMSDTVKYFEARGCEVVYIDLDSFMVKGGDISDLLDHNSQENVSTLVHQNLEFDDTFDVILYSYGRYHMYRRTHIRPSATKAIDCKLKFKFYKELYNRISSKIFNLPEYTYQDMLTDIFIAYKCLVEGNIIKGDFTISSIYSGNYKNNNFYLEVFGSSLKEQGYDIITGKSIEYFVTDTTKNDILGNRLRHPSNDDSISVSYYMKTMTLLDSLFGLLYDRKTKYTPPCLFLSKININEELTLEKFLEYYDKIE